MATRLNYPLPRVRAKPGATGARRRLPSQVRRLEESLSSCDRGQLANTLHQLKGAGGTFGYMNLSCAAEKIERLLHDQCLLETVAVEVEALIAMVRSVKGFDADETKVLEAEAS